MVWTTSCRDLEGNKNSLSSLNVFIVGRTLRHSVFLPLLTVNMPPDKNVFNKICNGCETLPTDISPFCIHPTHNGDDLKGIVSLFVNFGFINFLDSERRLLGDSDWEEDHHHRGWWRGPASGEKHEEWGGIGRLCECWHCGPCRPLLWRYKRPSSNTPTCWWQKQWLSGKRSLQRRSFRTEHR